MKESDELESKAELFCTTIISSMKIKQYTGIEGKLSIHFLETQA